jgi:uroporphyrinogen decarboxylase
MDAAIIFADILLVPQALGQKLSFGDGGPLLEALEETTGIKGLRLEGALSRLDPVCETIRRSRAALPAETALIGFAGAPWTVATYMVEGGASRDFQRVKSWAYRNPASFQALINLLTEATIVYLSAQISAGVEVVQLFDSWAGMLPEEGFERWVIAPTRRITAALAERFPEVPIIGFPRGAGLLYERYAIETGVSAVSLDTVVPKGFARERLQSRLAVQGNLDPVLLISGGEALEQAVIELRTALGGGPFVFNLGHGVLPQTPSENVAVLARLLSMPLD